MAFSFSAINLGCSKNLVDLEFAIGEILKYSDRTPIEYYDNPEDEDVEYVIVNTCWFLSSAREESEETLRYYDSLGKKLLLMGCYVSVKDDVFLASLKHLHSVVPFVSYSIIEELLFWKKSKLDMSALVRAKVAAKQAKEKKLSDYLWSIGWNQRGKQAFVWKWDEVRAYIHAPFGYEYLKIAEGCDNSCTFCIIPQIRGKQTSRKIEDILKEVQSMLDNGIREIQIISQDTTRYGTDLYGEARLFDLLEKIDAISGDFKIRLYYLYPDILTLDHLTRLKKLKKLLPYFDIPFQHSSEHILKRMGRHYDRNHINSFLDYIRKEFPNSFIRTSFIIGFPGETDEDFEDLYNFIQEYQFESVGIFQYHDESLAASSKLDYKIDDSIAKDRIHRISELLNTIYASYSEKAKLSLQVGFVMNIEKNTITIRREIQAPEVDEYDIVDRKNISHWENIEIGAKITYSL